MTLRAYKKYIRNKKGMTLLLVVVLLAAFLSISMGIINILLGQIFTIGQSGESFHALYASDIGMERSVYRDRVQNVCTGGCRETKTFADGSCYDAVVAVGPSASCAAPSFRCLIVKGKSLCGGNPRYVQRQFDLKY